MPLWLVATPSKPTYVLAEDFSRHPNDICKRLTHIERAAQIQYDIATDCISDVEAHRTAPACYRAAQDHEYRAATDARRRAEAE
jgi:hypothetical protein